MKIAILREKAADEPRVAASPETVGKFIALGATVNVEKGAGTASRMLDDAYKDAGATISASAATTVKDADIVLCVRRPAAKDVAGAAKGALVIATMDPFGHEADIAALAKTGVTAVAMEFMPRITRAQSMDVLSSQANLAGYQSIVDAAERFDRALPMMMTAAGTVHPAKVFVMGAGVAGLQAIATARRLGAVVSATDVRAAAGEQVESLGAKFIMTEALKDASGEGGYARELTEDEQKAQSELVAGHIAKQDIVVTTALIPGRPAPRLVNREMVESMAPGSVIVDLAAERGGNVELTKPGEVITHKDVTLIGYTNVQGRIASTASQLYARNLLNFVDTLIDKQNKSVSVDWEDELVTATVLTRDGAIVHPNITAPKSGGGSAAKPRAKTAGKSASSKSAASKSAASKSTASKSSSAKSSSAKSTGSRTGGSSSTASKSGASKSTASKSTTAGKPTTRKSAASKGSTGKAPSSGSAGSKSAASKSAASKSDATKSDASNSGASSAGTTSAKKTGDS